MSLDKTLKNCRKSLESLADRTGQTPDLKGLCAISSYRLFKRLKKNGLEGEIVLMSFENGISHCWIESGGEAFDLTMTQFGYGEIIKLERKKYLKLLFSNKVMKVVEKKCLRFGCEKVFKNHLKTTGWHWSQIPR